MKIRQLAALVLLFSITCSVYGMESGKPDIPKEADEQLPIGQNTLGLPDVLLNSFPIQQVILKHYQFSYPTIVAQVLSHMSISPTKSFNGHYAPIETLTFSPDGKLLASGESYRKNNIHLWDLESGLCIKTLSNNGWVSGLRFNSDGKKLISGSCNSDTFWNVDSTSSEYGTCLETIRRGFEPSPYFAGEHPTEKTIALTLANIETYGMIKLQNLYSAHDKHYISKILPGHGPHCLTDAVIFSPDGKILASAGSNPDAGGQCIKLWNLDPQLTADKSYGCCIKTLARIDYHIYKLRFSPNGKIIAAVGSNIITFWDIDSETCIYTLNGIYSDIAFSPNGMTLATGSSDAIIKLWDLTPLYKMKEYLESRIPLKAKMLLWYISQTKSPNKRLYLNKVNKKIFKSLHPIVQTALQNDVEFLSKKQKFMQRVAKFLHIKH